MAFCSLLPRPIEPENDRLMTGVFGHGPRVLTFAPILSLGDIPLNNLLKSLLKLCEEVVGHEVEVEFAVALDPENGVPARFGFLQVRPMFVSRSKVDVPVEDLEAEDVLIASEKVLGNGLINTVRDVVFLKVTDFDRKGVLADCLRPGGDQSSPGRRRTSIPVDCLRPSRYD